MMFTEEEMLAYHEAGHAVIRVVLGEPFDHVTIVPGDGYLGRVKSEDQGDTPGQYDDEFEDWAVRRYLVFLAGQETERVLLGEEDHDQQQVEADYGGVPISLRPVIAPYDSDNGSLIDLALGLVGTKWVTDRWMPIKQGMRVIPEGVDGSGMMQDIDDTPLREECHRLIRENREAIKAVAKALLERETLSGDEVTAIVSRIAES